MLFCLDETTEFEREVIDHEFTDDVTRHLLEIVAIRSLKVCKMTFTDNFFFLFLLGFVGNESFRKQVSWLKFFWKITILRAQISGDIITGIEHVNYKVTDSFEVTSMPDLIPDIPSHHVRESKDVFFGVLVD